eukprot:4542641-Amphidinium_carterae.1
MEFQTNSQLDEPPGCSGQSYEQTQVISIQQDQGTTIPTAKIAQHEHSPSHHRPTPHVILTVQVERKHTYSLVLCLTLCHTWKLLWTSLLAQNTTH